MKKFKYFIDPGHGWLKVPLVLIHELSLHEEISACSYMRGCSKGVFVYLEEDRDLGLFVSAYRKHFKKEPTIVYSFSKNSSNIRKYRGYVANLWF